jgi:colicin import membrane protein
MELPMTYIIKYKWALIGTFFLHVGVMAYMNRVKLERHYVPMGQLEQIPLVLEEKNDISEEEKIKQEQLQNGKISNITVNENDKVGESDQKYDSRAVKISDSDVEKDMREYEKNAFDEAASKHKKDDIVVVDPKLNDKKIKKDDNSSSNENNKVRSAGRVSGSYDLDGRRDEYFAKPAYVCKGSGTIVLKVKVNRSGKVISATIDSGQSSFTEDCMAENAVKYAYKCKFEAGTQWPEPQSGTVTYTYISQ